MKYHEQREACTGNQGLFPIHQVVLQRQISENHNSITAGTKHKHTER